VIFPHDANAKKILSDKPKGVFISDGPGGALPPQETIDTIKALLGKVPILACGLGHVALGMALGCKPMFLKRGHHGANYPVKNTEDARVEVTEQRHTVALDRENVLGNPRAKLLFENINDSSVEGICVADGSAIGLQPTLAPAQPGQVNPHIKRFVDTLARG
jgi:carbamoyl-phosphate synthase small subunit